jgi:hypothetical protein
VQQLHELSSRVVVHRDDRQTGGDEDVGSEKNDEGEKNEGPDERRGFSAEVPAEAEEEEKRESGGQKWSIQMPAECRIAAEIGQEETGASTHIPSAPKAAAAFIHTIA